MNSVERNNAIGLVLIAGMLMVYFTFFADLGKPATNTTDIRPKSAQSSDSGKILKPTTDTLFTTKYLGAFAPLTRGNETIYTLKNNQISASFSNKGARIYLVELLNYKSYAQNSVSLLHHQATQLTQHIQTAQSTIDISQLYATLHSQTDSSVTFIFVVSDSQYIKTSYYLPQKGYEITQTTEAVGMRNLLAQPNVQVNLVWHAPLLEKDLTASRQAANANYRLFDGTFKSLSETSTDPQEQTIESRVHWFTLKEKFFSVGIISEKGFDKGSIASEVPVYDSTVVKKLKASYQYPLGEPYAIKYYLGPNKLNIVKKVAPDFVENVYLGWPVINTINRYTIAPLFELLEKLNINYGIIIILMVIIIKAVLFPLSYRAYYAMAKIKVLKPELDEIKARVGDDMGAMQQEQMKLYNQVGVNPLSGCVPVLLQMPVLLAMFNFFPNAIELRQQPFLWAEDLSSYDSILSLPFKIPFYGDHVSLFALLMTASTILYTWYNSQLNVSATGPMMAMQYIMPIVFMFVLNSMPAGLSFYYFVSNMITIGQQYIIKLFVDEKAIRAKLDENKKNLATKKPNRFQQRLMEAMEQQQELKKKQKSTKK